MIEQVFELSLPPIEDVLEVSKNIYDNKNQYAYEYHPSYGIFKTEWCNFMNLTWDTFRYFKKSSLTGSIHTDSFWNHTDGSNRCIWGINWITNGDGILEFWNWDQVIKVGNTQGSDNTPKFGVVPKYFPKCAPYKKYVTSRNKVYLVNATLPHRASGKEGREAWSLRPNTLDIPWNKVINMFDNYII